MAYSNINRDKAQVKLIQKLKIAVITVVLVVFAISAWINIWQQVTTLGEARNRNQEALNKINGLELENKKIEKQIQDATGSAYQQRKIREYLGLGGTNDHWLVVDLGNTDVTAAEEIPESGGKTVIMQWWNLFAR
jgi:ABC-type Fe3+-hydroxamate transport system substrate-binding protein